MPSVRPTPFPSRACLALASALVVAAVVAGQPPDAEPPTVPSRFQRYLDAIARAQAAALAEQKPLAAAYLAVSPPEHRGWEWHYLMQFCKTGVPSLTWPAGDHCSAFSPDGWFFAADGPDGTVLYRGAVNGAPAGTFRGHHFPVRRLTFDSTGERLASAGWDDKESEVKVWDLPRERELSTTRLPGRLISLGFSDDPPRLVCQHADPAGTSTELTVFDSRSGEQLFARTMPGTSVVMALEPFGNRLAAARYVAPATEVKVWDLTEGKPLLTLDGPGAPPTALAFGPDQRTLALQTAAGNRLWLLGTGERLQLFDPGLPLLYHPDGRCLALVRLGEDGLRLCDATTGNEVVTLKGCRGTPVFSPGGDRLAALDRDLHVWETDTGQEVLTLPGPPPTPEGRDEPGLTFSDGGERLFAGTTVWDGTPEPAPPPVEVTPVRPWGFPDLTGVFDSAGLLALLAAFPIIWGSSFIHEVGHAVLGRWAGFRVTSFGMGVARPLWVGQWGHTRVYVCLSRPFQGITFSFLPQIVPSRGQMVASLAGGVLAQGVLLVVALGLWWFVQWGEPVWLVAAVFNLFGVVLNLVPMSVKVGQFTLQSDGALIVRVLRTGSLGGGGPGGLRLVRALRPLWVGVGDTLGLYVHLLGAANTWLALGDAEEAGRLSAEAEALPLGDEPEARGLGLLLRAGLARVAGNFDEAGRLLDETDAIYSAGGHALGRWLVRGERAEVLLARGEARQALAEMDALAADPAVADRPSVRACLLTPRLCAALAVEGPAGVERLAAEYRATQKQHAAPTGGIRLFLALANWHATREQWQEAGKAYRQALTVAGKLYAAVADAEDQERFLAALAGLRQTARECFVRQGMEEAQATSEIDGHFVAAAERERQAGDRAKRTKRLWQWAGWVLLALDLAVGVGLAAVCGRWGQAWAALARGAPLRSAVYFATNGEPWPVLVLCIAVFCAVAVVCNAGLWVVGRFVPKWRHAGGPVTVWLALAPWFGWLFHWLFT